MKKITKVLTLLLFVASLASLTSCKKAEKQLIVGKWKCTVATITAYNQSESFEPAIGKMWEFKSDGTLIVELIPEIDIENTSANYVINGNQLRVSYRDNDGEMEHETLTIMELTTTKLKLRENEFEFDDEYLTLEFTKL